MRRLAILLGPWALLVLWLTTLAFWAASYARVGTGWHVTYGSGAACLFYLDPATSQPYAIDAFDRAPDHSGWWVWQNLSGGTHLSDHRLLGFGLTQASVDRNEFNNATAAPFRCLLVEVPFWFLATATGVPAALALRRAGRRRARAATGRCVACGYDLRGSPGHCPECGTDVDAAGRSAGQSAA